VRKAIRSSGEVSFPRSSPQRKIFEVLGESSDVAEARMQILPRLIISLGATLGRLSMREVARLLVERTDQSILITLFAQQISMLFMVGCEEPPQAENVDSRMASKAHLGELAGAFPKGGSLRRAFEVLAEDGLTELQMQTLPRLILGLRDALKRIPPGETERLMTVQDDRGFFIELSVWMTGICVVIDNRLVIEQQRRLVELFSAEGGCLCSKKLAQKIGLSSGAIDTLRHEGKLLAVWYLKGWIYPRWQLQENGETLQGFVETFQTLRGRELNPIKQLQFFLTTSSQLGNRRPLDLLREQRIDLAKSEAEKYPH